MTDSNTPAEVVTHSDVVVDERDGFVYVRTPDTTIELDPDEAKDVASSLLDTYCTALTGGVVRSDERTTETSSSGTRDTDD